MEKKNMVLLTVIAVATLLVAVVGATFAYFTATVSTTNDTNKTTTVTTQTLVTATMDMGSKVEATNVLPGHSEMKKVLVKGDGTANSRAVDTVITVTPNIPAAFGSDVTWTLYEVDGDVEVTNCTNTPNTTGTDNKYFETASCTLPSGATSVLTGSTSQDTYDLKVAYNTTKTYVLKVDYKNNETVVQNPAGENNQAGQTYSVTLGFASK